MIAVLYQRNMLYHLIYLPSFTSSQPLYLPKMTLCSNKKVASSCWFLYIFCLIFINYNLCNYKICDILIKYCFKAISGKFLKYIP